MRKQLGELSIQHREARSALNESQRLVSSLEGRLDLSQSKVQELEPKLASLSGEMEETRSFLRSRLAVIKHQEELILKIRTNMHERARTAIMLGTQIETNQVQKAKELAQKEREKLILNGVAENHLVQIQGLQSKVQEGQSRVEELESQVLEGQTRVDQAKKTQQDLNKDKAALEGAAAAQLEQIHGLEAKLKASVNQVATLQGSVATLQASVASLSKTHVKESADLEAQVKAAQEALSKAEKEMQKVRKQGQMYTAELEDSNTYLERLISAIALSIPLVAFLSTRMRPKL